MGEEGTAGDSRAPYADLMADPKLLALSMASYVGMFNTAVVSPALPRIQAVFGVSDVGIGLVMSLFTLPGIVFVMVVGAIADVYGRRTLLLLSLLLLSIAGVAIAFVDSFAAILALRVVQGVGAAALMPLVSTLIGDLYEGVARSTVHGIRASVNGVSMLFMPVVVGVVVTFSWRYAFLLFAGAFVSFGAVFVFLPESNAGLEPGSSLSSSLRRSWLSTLTEIRGGQQGLVVIGGFVRGFSILALLTFVPLFAARSLTATAFAIGLIVAMRGVARVVVAPFAGALLSRFSHRAILTVALLVSAGSVLIIPFSPGVVALGLLVGVYSVGDSLFFPAHQDVLTLMASPDNRAGVLSAASLLRKIGAAASPVFFGVVLATGGFTPLFITVALALAGYAVLLVSYMDV